MKDLHQISVIGMGLLGASLTLTMKRSLSSVKTVGYSHRAVTRKKARELGVSDVIVEDICECVANADIVVIATPICTFEQIFKDISKSIPDGCIVTDVGSVKVLPHRWAAKHLSRNVRYVGSHPIAGSEKRGVEYSRDDLFSNAQCILTLKKTTDRNALRTLKNFWSELGCKVNVMSPVEHDRIFARISHVPHVTATALVNASDKEAMKFAGKGFIDTSRLASGPETIWTDILMTNSDNTARGIDKLIKELTKFQKAVKNRNKKQIERLLLNARDKRSSLIKYKMSKKELI